MATLVKFIWKLLLLVHPHSAGKLALYVLTRPIQSRRKKPLNWPGYTSHFAQINGEDIHFLKSAEEHDQYVALFHGWMGKIEQFKLMTEVLEDNDNGLGLILVDLPAHGQSSGTRADARSFAACIDYFNSRENLSGIVCHSLAGLATAISINELLSTYNRVVFISAPSSGPEILNDFIKRIQAPEKIREPLKMALFNKYGIEFDEFHGAAFIKERPQSIQHFLNYHDTHDDAVPLEDGLTYAEAYGVECQVTDNLGHNRILKNSTVIRGVLDFLKS